MTRFLRDYAHAQEAFVGRNQNPQDKVDHKFFLFPYDHHIILVLVGCNGASEAILLPEKVVVVPIYGIIERKTVISTRHMSYIGSTSHHMSLVAIEFIRKSL
jgi:hypothetical protein